jgi:hypothetical protein
VYDSCHSASNNTLGCAFRLLLLQVGDVLDQCSAVVLKAGKEGQYEREGYGQRPYDNWETVMIDCNGRVSNASLPMPSRTL